MSKLNDITSVRIQGGFFEEGKKLGIFENEKQIPRFSLVYGKNGSGKTTIARAFYHLTHEDGESEVRSEQVIELLDSVGNGIDLDQEDKNSIFVFDEDFIEHEIHIEADGLNAIVMTGAEKDIDEQIAKLAPLLEESNAQYDTQQKKCDRYANSKDELSPLYYEEEIKNVLKKPGGWAENDSYCREKKVNTAVKAETFERLIKINPSKPRDELIIELDQAKKEFEIAKTGGKLISLRVPTVLPFHDIEDSARAILSKKIEQPILTSREKYIFSLLEEKGDLHLQEVKTYFSDATHKRCPYCFQDVSEEYAASLTSSIEKILSNIAEEHQEQLKKINCPTYDVDFSVFGQLNEAVRANCEQKMIVLNQAFEQIKSALSEKISNVYTPIHLPSLNLRKKYDDFVTALQMLEDERVKYNTKASNKNAISNKMQEINDQIAKYDIDELYKKFQQQGDEQKNEIDILNKCQSEISLISQQLEELRAKKNSVHFAMDAINEDLQYIFFSKERLYIECKDNKYLLFSHGKPVSPISVSAGERNAIGLCYFFNKIFEKKEKNQVYNLPYFLIIDDPVSSLDMENRVGILSYLKYQLKNFALGNKESRFLIMTHDLQTLFDGIKLVDEILSKCHNAFPGDKRQNLNCKNILELKHLQMVNFDVSHRHEYTMLVEKVYDFALNPKEYELLNIGNNMRKLLEAFGTFTYKKGIEELSTDEIILSELNEEEKRYFENLMYRLVINGESHMRDRVKTMNDMDFFEYISDEEKRRTAKDILCFLYKLNPKHILAHLSNRDGAEEQIKQWCQEIIRL